MLCKRGVDLDTVDHFSLTNYICIPCHSWHFPGGWWFNTCGDTNLNGRYIHVRPRGRWERRRGIHWRPSGRTSYSLRFTQISIHPAAARSPASSTSALSKTGNFLWTNRYWLRPKERIIGNQVNINITSGEYYLHHEILANVHLGSHGLARHGKIGGHCLKLLSVSRTKIKVYSKGHCIICISESLCVLITVLAKNSRKMRVLPFHHHMVLGKDIEINCQTQKRYINCNLWVELIEKILTLDITCCFSLCISQ